MSRYQLRVLCDGRQAEVFNHRSKGALSNILTHARFIPGMTYGIYGEPLTYGDKFEIFDSQMMLVFSGSREDALSIISNLK